MQRILVLLLVWLCGCTRYQINPKDEQSIATVLANIESGRWNITHYSVGNRTDYKTEVETEAYPDAFGKPSRKLKAKETHHRVQSKDLPTWAAVRLPGLRSNGLVYSITVIRQKHRAIFAGITQGSMHYRDSSAAPPNLTGRHRLNEELKYHLASLERYSDRPYQEN